MVTGLLFYAFAAILVVAALGVITARNPVHSALFLVLAFVQSAALWLLIEAEFLAIALVLVYVGAVMVLFLFVVMMLDINVEELRKGFTRYLPLGVAVALIVVVEIGHVVWFRSQGLAFLTVPEPLPADYSNTKALGARALHGARLRVRDRRRDPAARDRRGDHAHDAAAPRAQGAERRAAGRRASRGPRAARESGVEHQSDDDHRIALPRARGRCCSA